MNSKKLSKKSPSYYVPLPFVMAVHRAISAKEAKRHLFEGMSLHLRKIEIPALSIAVIAHYDGSDNYVGFIPQGMLARMEQLMEFEEDIALSVECTDCEKLANTLWITIEELPSIQSLGLQP